MRTLPDGPVTSAQAPHQALPAQSGLLSAATFKSLGLASNMQAPSPVAA
jgi:hypothetical protein